MDNCEFYEVRSQKCEPQNCWINYIVVEGIDAEREKHSTKINENETTSAVSLLFFPSSLRNIFRLCFFPFLFIFIAAVGFLFFLPSNSIRQQTQNETLAKWTKQWKTYETRVSGANVHIFFKESNEIHE